MVSISPVPCLYHHTIGATIKHLGAKYPLPNANHVNTAIYFRQ